MTADSGVALRRITLKDLEPDLSNILIVGIIIGKQKPRKFSDPKSQENGGFRAVWNFTLRDSPQDYINVTFWGQSEIVFAANDKFYAGDVVEIVNPRVNIRKFNDAGEHFRPMVTSPYSLTLTEYSELNRYSGDAGLFAPLLNLPTKPIPGFVPLRDIQNEGASLKDRFVDILTAVRDIGTIRNITTKTGNELQLREVILFDHTSPGLKFTIWDPDVMIRAVSWKPRQTILFITDVKVEWSNFLRSYSAALTNRSIVTENPVGKDASSLALYAKNAPLEASAILDQMITLLPDPETIRNVMSVQQVHNKLNLHIQENNSSEQQLTALMYVFVTKLDLDGLTPSISTKCTHCKNYLKNNAEKCENLSCPSGSNGNSNDFDVGFDIRIHLTDHTGTLINCRLSGKVAEEVLGCSVHQFLKMTDDQKCTLKWKYLMERCAVRVMVLLLNRRNPVISIVSCNRADAQEAVQRMPVY